MQEPKHQMETDFHLYRIVISQISYLHHHPFWSSLGQECQPRIAWFLSSAILHADLVPHTRERVECGIALDFEARLRPDPKTCLCGTQCVSGQGRTEISMCCCCDRFWVPGHLPQTVKTPTTPPTCQQLPPPETLTTLPSPL